MTVSIPREKLRSFILTQFSRALQKGLVAEDWIVMQCLGMAVDNVEVDMEIPENLYKAVAQVLAYVFSLKGKAG